MRKPNNKRLQTIVLALSIGISGGGLTATFPLHLALQFNDGNCLYELSERTAFVM